MLKVSGDGKDLVCVETGRADAWWVNGWLRVRLSWAAPEDLQTLAAFIQAGPPQEAVADHADVREEAMRGVH